MKALQKILLLLALLLVAPAALAQTQAILPNSMTQFVDGNGAPYAGGQVYMYVPFTTTPKTTYQDPNGKTPNQNPITLDANGRAIIWGSGEYRQILRDQYGVTVWDQLTFALSPTSLGATGTIIWYGAATGTANAITLGPSVGFTATDGQVVGFVANATNTGATTVNASSYGSVVLEKSTIAGPAALTGGEIFIGNTYYATYVAAIKSFILIAFPTPAGTFSKVASNVTTNASGAYFYSPVFDVVAFGAVGDGVTDNATALQAAFTAAAVAGGQVRFPCGVFVTKTAITTTVLNGTKVAIKGGGADCSVMAMQGAINGPKFIYGGIWSSVDVQDITFTTNQIGSGSTTPIGLILTTTVANGDGSLSAQNTIQNVIMRGADLYTGAQTEYWGIGISGFDISNVNITNYFFDGLAAAGNAISIKGDTSQTNYAVVWNISHSTINECNIAVAYGDYVQGVTLTGGTNVVGCNYGVYTAAGVAGNLDQLTVADSQFNVYICAVCMSDQTFADLIVTGNLFLVPANAIGVQTLGFDWVITGNVFRALSGTGTIGVAVVGGQASGGKAEGNFFYSLLDGFEVSAAATNAQAQLTGNKFIGTVVPYAVNSSARFVYIDDTNTQNFATLPACNASIAYSRMFTADATTATYNAAVIGGGTNFVVALCDGTSWKAH